MLTFLKQKLSVAEVKAWPSLLKKSSWGLELVDLLACQPRGCLCLTRTLLLFVQGCC